jgi:Zn-dependent M28 family amino/carboxypeptidase
VHAGADDNASVTAADLAAARAFVKQPGKRSVLFINHGSEERGLIGSRYHAAHPVVPLTQIVAVLNGDMIGRNNPDSAALLGSQPPHRNSSDLVAMGAQGERADGESSRSTRSGTGRRTPEVGTSAAITCRTHA